MDDEDIVAVDFGREILRASMRNSSWFVDAALAAGHHAAHDDELGWMVVPHVAAPQLNAVRTFYQHKGVADRVDQVVAEFPAHLPVSWWVMSDDGRDEIAQSLHDAGFGLDASVPVLAGRVPPTEPEPVEGLAVSAPASEQDWQGFSHAAQQGHRLSEQVTSTLQGMVQELQRSEGRDFSVDAMVARRGGQCVGSALVSHRADVAGLWAMTTVPSARRTGVGTALIDQRLGAARARGTDVAFFFSGGNAEPLYRARGFHQVGSAEFFVLPPRA